MTTNNQQDPGTVRNQEYAVFLNLEADDTELRGNPRWATMLREVARRLDSNPSEMAARCGDFATQITKIVAVEEPYDIDTVRDFQLLNIRDLLTELSQVPSAGEKCPNPNCDGQGLSREVGGWFECEACKARRAALSTKEDSNG